MRKFLLKNMIMIFGSVILAFLIFIIPNQKVDAATYVTNMSSKYNSISTYSEISVVYEVIDFLKSIEDDYYVVFTLNTYNYYYNVFIAEKNVSVTNSTYYYDGTGSRILLNLSSSTKAMNKSIANTNLKSQYKNFQYYFENNNFSTYSSFDINPGKLAYILYSNIDFKVSLGSSNEMIYNDKSLSVNSKIPSYYDWYLEKYSSIIISSNYANDLNGKSMEVVTIDFANVYNSSYRYEFKTSLGEWIDITDYVYDATLYGYYYYQFNTYYNTLVEARVLDSSGNVLKSVQYNVNNSELMTFGLSISSGLACPIPNYDGDPLAEMIVVDFSSAYSEKYKYYYSYDNKTEYEMVVSSDNLQYIITEYLYNFIYFYIYDENGRLIYHTHNDVSSSTRLGYIPDDYSIRHKVFIKEGPACDLEGNNVINVVFDFSNITKYVDHYNFNVVINGNNLGSIQYYEMVLNEKNYVQNYDIKIYIDTFLYYSRSYAVGHLIDNEPIQGDFEDKGFNNIYNEILNNMSSELIENNETLFNLFTNSLNHFRDIIVDIFSDCTYLFNNLNSTLKYFYISVFVLILFGFLIKFIL